MDISTIATRELVSELAVREGVKSIRVNPYEGFSVGINGNLFQETGPAVIMVVTD